MEITVSYSQTCLPDYWQGSDLPTLSVPVDGDTTRKELVQSLSDELDSGIVDFELSDIFGSAEAVPYADIKQALTDCIFWHENIKGNDKPFQYLEKRADDNEESAYAYFVIEVSSN